MSGSKIKSKHRLAAHCFVWRFADVDICGRLCGPGVRVCGNVNSVKSETRLAGAGVRPRCGAQCRVSVGPRSTSAERGGGVTSPQPSTCCTGPRMRTREIWGFLLLDTCLSGILLLCNISRISCCLSVVMTCILSVLQIRIVQMQT